MSNDDRLPPGAAEILAQLERGELTETARLTAVRAMRAALDGRSAVEIIASGAREMRDEALRAMRDAHFAELAPSTAAKQIAQHLARYAASTWPTDRDAATPPCAGTLRRAACDVLRVGRPPAWRTVLSALQRYPLSVANSSTPKPTPEAT